MKQATALDSIPNGNTNMQHEIWLKGKGSLEALYTITNNFPKIMSAATMLTFIEEGIDIMFQRFRDSLAKEKKLKEESETRGAAKVYKEIADWNTRRMEAEACNDPFTEPPRRQKNLQNRVSSETIKAV